VKNYLKIPMDKLQKITTENALQIRGIKTDAHERDSYGAAPSVKCVK